MLHLQSEQFADADPAAVKQFQHSPIPKAAVGIEVRLAKQLFHFTGREDLREGAPFIGQAQGLSGVVEDVPVLMQEAVKDIEAAQERHLRVHR